MINKILSKISHEVSLLYLFITNYVESKEFARLSVLSRKNTSCNSKSACPICLSEDVNVFARFPMNLPVGQNHSLLYFDYEKNECAMRGLDARKKKILDRTLGFFLSLTWEFCSNCRNGSLSAHFDSKHMLKYYEDFYVRDKKVDDSRRNTKWLHGSYISSLVSGKSSILEIGAADGITAEYLSEQNHKVYVYEPSRQFSGQLEKSSSITYLSDFSTCNGQFDAIYLHHVLEHIPDPIAYSRTLRPLLKDNGFILIQVPDLSLQLDILEKICRKSIYSLFNRPHFNSSIIKKVILPAGEAYNWFDVLANDHISAFTPDGIKYVLEKAGFTVISIIRSTSERISNIPSKYAWPVDEETGNTPNGLSVIGGKSII